MRLIRPADPVSEGRWAVAVSLAMVAVGGAAIVLMGLLPGDRVALVLVATAARKSHGSGQHENEQPPGGAGGHETGARGHCPK